MSGGYHLKAVPRDVVYQYDGSFDGFLCCVHQSIVRRELPFDIAPEQDASATLFPAVVIVTDAHKAKKVYHSICQTISPSASSLIETVFFSCLPQKELHLLRFLFKGYRYGASILNMLGDETVAPLQKAAKHLGREAHLLQGFVRFSENEGTLAAVISPKNFVLPFIAEHFIRRYQDETFLIFDQTHKAALIWQDKRKRIVALDHIVLPELSPQEQQFQSLWKHFYNTVAIEERTNPRCRMTHMPKRYWTHMPEVQHLL